MGQAEKSGTASPLDSFSVASVILFAALGQNFTLSFSQSELVVLKLVGSGESPGGLVKTQIPGPHSYGFRRLEVEG